MLCPKKIVTHFCKLSLGNNHKPQDHWLPPRPLKMPEKLNCQES